MRHGRDRLHLDCVPLLESVVENAGRVHDLPAQILVVGVADVQGLCGECVWLDFNVGVGYLVEEAGFADVGKAADKEGPCVGVDGRETRQVLADLLEVF